MDLVQMHSIVRLAERRCKDLGRPRVNSIAASVGGREGLTPIDENLRLVDREVFGATGTRRLRLELVLGVGACLLTTALVPNVNKALLARGRFRGRPLSLSAWQLVVALVLFVFGGCRCRRGSASVLARRARHVAFGPA